MNRAFTPSSKKGFTLIEVSLAVLVVGLGLLSLFGLFPSGLRAGEEASADTRAGLFATVVLEGMRANAAGIKVWSEWDDASMLGSSSKLCDAVTAGGTAIVADGVVKTINDFPAGSGKRIRYSLTIDRPPTTTRSCSAYMRVWERTGSSFNEFYTEFLFGGR
jgi:prepilin-type N-terminal cleavage/methylation domain-containing protein